MTTPTPNELRATLQWTKDQCEAYRSSIQESHRPVLDSPMKNLWMALSDTEHYATEAMKELGKINRTTE